MTTLDVDVTERDGELEVDYRIETTADSDGFWEGVVEVFIPGQDDPIVSEDISGFVDAFDDPPFTDGEVTFDVADITGGAGFEEATVVVTWFEQESISETVETTVGDGDEGDVDETVMELEVDAVGDDIEVEWYVETPAENDGFWEGIIEVFTNGDTPAVEREITGFVDAFDTPPFTSGDETIPKDGLGLSSSQTVSVVVTWTSQVFISDTVDVFVEVIDDPDEPEEPDDPDDPEGLSDNMGFNCNVLDDEIGQFDPLTIEITISNDNDVPVEQTVDVVTLENRFTASDVGSFDVSPGSSTIETIELLPPEDDGWAVGNDLPVDIEPVTTEEI